MDQFIKIVERCPFCLDVDVDVVGTESISGSYLYYVECRACYAGGPPRETPGLAIGAWNAWKADKGGDA